MSFNLEDITSVTKVNDEVFTVVCGTKIFGVPKDTDNLDYQTILKWDAIDGNTIGEPA